MKRLLFFLLLCVECLSSFAQNPCDVTDPSTSVIWGRKLGNPVPAFNADLQVRGDYNPVTQKEVLSTGVGVAGGQDLFIAQIGANGSLNYTNEFTNIYNAPWDQKTHAVKYAANGDIITSGTYNMDVKYLMRTDALGNVLWCRYFIVIQQQAWDVGNLTELNNGDIVMVGGGSNNSQEVFVIKTDPMGNLICGNTYNIGRNYADLMDVTPTNDGGFIAVGSGGHLWDYWGGLVMKFNANCGLQWKNIVRKPHPCYDLWTVGCRSSLRLTAVIQMQNGNYAAVGWVSDYDQYTGAATFKKGLICQFDLAGNIIGQRLLTNGGTFLSLYDVVETAPKILTVCGQSINSTGMSLGYTAQVDANTNLVNWARTYNDVTKYNTINTTAPGFILMGDSLTTPVVQRVGPMGDYNCSIMQQPILEQLQLQNLPIQPPLTPILPIQNPDFIVNPACICLEQTCNYPVVCHPITPPCNLQVAIAATVNCSQACFTAAVTGCTGVLSYNWSFPGSTTPISTLANPCVTYPTNGVYVATLTVTCIDPTGVVCTATANYTVIINNTPCSLQATFTAAVNCSQVCFTSAVTGCNGVLTYSWNFGAGGVPTSTAANPCVTYPISGTYPVTLTVTCVDSCGNICTKTISSPVTVTGAFSSTFCYTLTASTKTVTLNGVVTTGCTGTKTYKWQITNAAGVVVYLSPTALASPNINYTFPTSGLYTICLITKCTTGNTSCCTQCCKDIIVPEPCAALNPDFTYLIPASGYNIVFNSSTATSACITYSWTVTNGGGAVVATAAIKTPTFTLAPGTYTVCQTVECNQGVNGGICTKQSCKTICISTNVACTSNANFRYINCGNNTFTFTNLSTGATSYSWNFGDGTTSALASPVKTYTTPGDYMVSLTINAGTNCWSRIKIKVKVAPIVCNVIPCASVNMKVLQNQNQGEATEAPNTDENDSEQITRTDEVSKAALKLFPNPTNGILKVQAEDDFLTGATIYVYDMKGDLLYEKSYGQAASEVEIDMSSFTNGLYMVAIQGKEGEVITHKIVKE